MIGVKYIQAVNRIWYISETSGKYVERVDRIRPMPNVKNANKIMGTGKKNNVTNNGERVVRITINSGTRLNSWLTKAVPIAETPNIVRGT